VVCRLPIIFRLSTAGTAPYTDALVRCASRGLKSGVVFDALRLLDAEQAGGDVFLTFNASDFTRLAVEASPQVVVPSVPPSELVPG